MAADSIKVTQNGTTLGELVVEGRLLDLDGTKLSGFKQTYRVVRGKRVVELDIELDPQTEPRADPWNSYFAARFAWADEAADLWCSVNQSRQPVGAKRFEAPQYIEIEGVDSKKRTTILTGGLPFHRRCGLRMLDSLLIVRGESGRKFRMGIGLDLNHPMQAAIDLLTPAVATQQVAATPLPAASSWLFHLDAKNVVATHWEPIAEAGNIVGFRVRLLETAGRPVRAMLSSFRNVKHARQVDFQGNSLGDCKVDDGRIRLDFTAGEWIEVEGRWS
jgi:alpha-mannosidase